MSDKMVREAIVGGDNASVSLAEQIGLASHRLGEIADEMGKARTEDTARFDELRAEQQVHAQTLSALKAKADDAERESQLQVAIDAATEWQAVSASFRNPSKAAYIAGGGGAPSGYTAGDFLFAVHEAAGRDADRQTAGKAILTSLAQKAKHRGDASGFDYQSAWGKATVGSTDATGGWIIPNAIVDELIVPASVANIYRGLMTIVPGVTAPAVDIPFRIGARTAATVIAFGETKENLNLVYNGYTATMYTLARIYDIGNQFLRQSRGAAEADVMAELAAGFAQGESNYIREGSGSSQPFGYTSALTNGPAGFRTSFTPSATTLAGSIARSIADAAGALAGRGVGADGRGLSAVLTASSYWTMLSQGTDTAGFFFNPAAGPTAINAPAGVLVSPFGIPVYPDAAADLQATGAVLDNLVVANWKKFKVYFGQTYRVDSSDQAGTRWDSNLTGFRGEEEMGFDARPAVYAGHAQMITDILP